MSYRPIGCADGCQTSQPGIRPATADDVAELCGLLNEIITIGGTTAIETPLSEGEFRDYFIAGPKAICCFVAVNDTGTLQGFQALERHDDLPKGWADIATFSRRHPKIPGVGTLLFQTTRQHAQAIAIAAINATIRADNSGGLAYYTKMGFEDYAINKAVLLNDGTPVDRISKRYIIG